MSESLPPVAHDIERRFGDTAVCLAEQDQLLADLKGQMAAQESRLHLVEREVAAIDQLWLHAGRPHVVFSEEHEQVRRGLPRHPYETRPMLKGVNEPVTQSKQDIDATHYFEGAGGGP